MKRPRMSREKVTAVPNQPEKSGRTIIGTTVRPGQKGTRELLKQYGISFFAYATIMTRRAGSDIKPSSL